jgi:hypothetical protein
LLFWRLSMCCFFFELALCCRFNQATHSCMSCLDISVSLNWCFLTCLTLVRGGHCSSDL